MSKNRKKGLRKMSKLFMNGTPLEGIEQLAVECIQSAFAIARLLGHSWHETYRFLFTADERSLGNM